jgi:hypothetical protein
MQKIVIPGKAGVQIDITDQTDKTLSISRVGDHATQEDINLFHNFNKMHDIASGPGLLTPCSPPSQARAPAIHMRTHPTPGENPHRESAASERRKTLLPRTEP